ncbi:MAG TPA: response regulator [Thermaerobacter sp.]
MQRRSGAGVRILVVDDVPSVRAFLQLALAEQGYEVHLADDGHQALEQARSVRPHLILMDWVMPRMHGGAVLKALQGDPQLRSIPVVLMTGSVGVDEIVAAYGVRWVLEKPFGLHDLLATVQAALAAAVEQA